MSLFQSRPILIFFTLFAFATLLNAGDSPVAPDSPMQHLSSDFELADGPAWNGWSLTIPDPFTEKAKRFIPSKNEWQPSLSGRRLSGSFYNHGFTYFVDNGAATILRREGNNKPTVLHQEDLKADKTRKPNDLVVDRTGGIYFTLTRAGQVVYVPSGKPAIIVAEDATSANGLISNPTWSGPRMTS